LQWILFKKNSMSYPFLFNVVEPSDALIVILFTLFVASTVNERIIDFIKLRVPDLYLKSFNQKEEFRRSKRLWLLAFGFGIFTAVLLNINFLTLLIDNKDVFGDKKLLNFIDRLQKESDTRFYAIAGCFFTALFISLGSKFWHDLLDLVLFIKNSQRKTNEFNPQGLTDIKQVDQYLKEDEFQVSTLALEANRERLEKAFPGASFHMGYEYIKQEFRLCVVVMDREKPASEKAVTTGSMKQISYITNYGYAFHFPIFILLPGKVETANEIFSPATAGGGLLNTATPQNIGTFGCIVRDVKNGSNEYFLLTCYHCVRVRDKHSWDGIKEESVDREVKYVKNFVDKKPFVVGKIKSGYRNGRMDIAMVKPLSNDIISDYQWSSSLTVPKGHRTVTVEDIRKKTRIWFSGARSGNCEGYIINIGYTEPVNYPGDEEPHVLRNLIVFSKTSAKPFKKPCNKGDSGTVILDAQTNEALGMIVACDDQFGYAIPIHDILELHGLALLTDPVSSIAHSY